MFPAYGDDDLFSRLKIDRSVIPKEAPGFRLEELNGGKVQLRDYKGKVICLTFWATWCGPCKEELPSLEALHQQSKGKDLVVLTVAVDFNGSIPVKKFMAKQGYDFQVLLDSKNEVLDLYRVERIPTSFLIDRKGRIAGKVLGPRNWRSPEAITLLNRMIAETGRGGTQDRPHSYF
jgi:peroxiredoxin